jgi:hypothetical protein
VRESQGFHSLGVREARLQGREGERGEGRKQAEEGSESDRAGVAAWVLGD